MNRKIWIALIGYLMIGAAACQSSAATPLPSGATTVQSQPVPAGDDNLTATASGLKYADLIVGSGGTPAATDYVTVQYTGTLDNGTVFDASRQHGGPAEFPLDQVIPGFTEGVGSMKIGGTRKLVIPPNLAYGSQANGPIPANSTITFIVELISVKPAPQVKVEDLVVGTGAEANVGSTLTVNYTGTLENGTVFDASYGKSPFDFQLGAGQVIPG
ncbi:MAG TPA: FKBP-type peptidyl-prolyl cis-trans isomerase, partial [Anaerolineae bacterium]|nr:FKBP-type peptidyl-prolyl cis-trans isomerase [Anaerolineae bacterium]